MATTDMSLPPKELNPSGSHPNSLFLSATPLEIRLEIYKHLLLLDLQPWIPSHLRLTPNLNTNPNPNTNPNNTKNHNPPLLHPSILSTCRQIHAEALPILYAQNIFLAHPTQLTSLPQLLLPHPGIPVSISYPNNPLPNPNASLIRRWRIRIRLDCPAPPWPTSVVTRAFSGADEVILQVWRAMFIGGVGVDVLRRFEGVRGVRRARILGCVAGFEGYVRWLEGVMMGDGEGENKGVVRGGCEYGSDYGKDRQDQESVMPLEGNKKVIMLGGYRCADELERKRLTGWVC